MSGTERDLNEDSTNPDERIIARAKKRFKRCQDWESVARKRWLEDFKFANGDSDNNYQWPGDVYAARNGDERPVLTINKVRQHNLQITNDAKQNKTGIKYRPVGDGATRDAADVFTGIARHIQDISHAQAAYGQAISFQVQCGLGWTRVVTEIPDDRSFDQEAFIRPVDDPLSCYLDPDCQQQDGSDARFGFIFADRPRDEVEAEYPEVKGMPAINTIDGDDAGWVREDHIRVAEYYEVEETRDTLYGLEDGTTCLRSEMTAELVKLLKQEYEASGETLKKRTVMRKKVIWYKIVGDKIVDETEWPGTTVPLIPWYGEVTVINQQLDRKGHTRMLKDAQRIYNYNRSAEVEFGALQSKSPWIAPVLAIEGLETYWETANRVNHSILPYNHINDAGQEIPAPQRQEPPTAAPVFQTGAMAADQDMMFASGQYQAEMGQPSNEKSGKAINERQRQGDRATYHFIDNQAIAIRRHGQILLEIIPKIYDTPRVIRILGEDGTESHVQLDPMAQAAHQRLKDGATEIFNPNVGKYDVVSDVGPDYATRRQEAFNAIVQVLTQAPQLLDKIGDLLFKVADFPLADEIADRLKPGLPEPAQKAISGLQEQLVKKNALLGETMQALSEKEIALKGKDQMRDIDAYKAETDRMKALAPMLPTDPVALQQLVHQLVADSLATHLRSVVAASAPDLRADAAGGGPAAGNTPKDGDGGSRLPLGAWAAQSQVTGPQMGTPQ